MTYKEDIIMLVSIWCKENKLFIYCEMIWYWILPQ